MKFCLTINQQKILLLFKAKIMTNTNKIKNIKPLLIRPNPFPDESLLGYIHRLAECNGFENTDYLSKFLIKSDNSKTRFNKDNYLPKHRLSVNFIHNLGYLTIKPPKTLYQLTLFPSERKDTDDSLNCNYSKVAYSNIYKFCAECLIEKNYVRKIWEEPIVTVCPFHKCLLTYFCPSCENLLQTSQTILNNCKCGFDLRETKVISVSNEETRLANHIYSITGLIKLEGETLSKNNPLLNYPYNDFSNIIYQHIKMIFSSYYDETFYSYKSLLKSDLHQLACEAFLIFENFPINYIKYLDKLAKKSDKLKKKSWFSFFTKSYYEFNTTIPSSFLSLLYKVFDSNFYEISVRNNLNINRSNSSTLIADDVLANQLGIEKTEIRYLAEKNEDLFKFYQFFKGKIYIFYGDMFYKIMSKTRSRIKQTDKPPKNLINLSHISKNNPIRKDFINLILRGKISIYAEDLAENGLNRFLFEEEDFRNILNTDLSKKKNCYDF